MNILTFAPYSGLWVSYSVGGVIVWSAKVKLLENLICNLTTCALRPYLEVIYLVKGLGMFN